MGHFQREAPGSPRLLRPMCQKTFLPPQVYPMEVYEMDTMHLFNFCQGTDGSSSARWSAEHGAAADELRLSVRLGSLYPSILIYGIAEMGWEKGWLPSKIFPSLPLEL